MTSFKPDNLTLMQDEEEIDVRVAEAGGMVLLWSRLRKGVDFGPTLAGLPDGGCSAPHWGYKIKGKLMTRTSQGEEVYTAGEAFHWAPDHVPVMLEDCECIDFPANEAYAAMWPA